MRNYAAMFQCSCTLYFLLAVRWSRSQSNMLWSAFLRNTTSKIITNSVLVGVNAARALCRLNLMIMSEMMILWLAVQTVMPHFAESQFAENPCHLLIFLKRKCRWRQNKLTLTVTLTITDTVTVIFLRAFCWHP